MTITSTNVAEAVVIAFLYAIIWYDYIYGHGKLVTYTKKRHKKIGKLRIKR